MAQAFVDISPSLAALCHTHVLLTPNERLAREYQHAYDQQQIAAGRRGWPSLRCFSLNQFLRQELKRFDDEISTEGNFLAPRLVPRYTLVNLIRQNAPLPSRALIQAFSQAWQLIHRYDVDLADKAFHPPRLQAFREWFAQVREALPPNCIIDEQIGDVLIAANCIPSSPLLLVDFEQLTRVERRYLEYANAHVAVEAYQGESAQLSPSWTRSQEATIAPHDTTSISGFDSLTQEIAAAAAWARDIKRSSPDASIGIVVPDLAAEYELVQNQCASMLDPLAGSESQVFDLSAGISLGDQPLWQWAKRYLQALANGFNQQLCRDLSQNRYFELSCLAALGQKWPKHFHVNVDANTLKTALIEDAQLPSGIDANAHATIEEWIPQLLECLDQAGWPRSSDLGSIAFQAHEALTRELLSYASQPLVAAGAELKPVPFEQALETIDLCLAQAIFAPQRARSDILVLGLLETTGLKFSHLWVCGLDENNFPGKSVTNPFIPRSVASRFGIPRSTAEDELAFAKRQLHAWCSRSAHLRVSYCMSQDDNEQHPSPLVTHFAIQPSEPSYHPYYRQAGEPLETFEDNLGHPLNGTKVVGGTGILKDQAQCPFKAYAQYRLGLKRPDSPENFPNALTRGNLLHECLFELVRLHSEQAALVKVQEAEIRHICQQIAAKLPLTYPSLFVEAELSRVTMLIINWLALEAQRSPFQAVHLEEAFTVNLAGLEFRIRIDRVDSCNDHLLVIDYKTGTVSLAGTTSSPITEPQLPVYSLIDDTLAGVYYGEVRDEPRFKGVGEPDHFIEGAGTNKLPQPWSAQRQAWRADLENIAQGIAEGKADVTPARGACDYCHLQSFCRIAEQKVPNR